MNDALLTTHSRSIDPTPRDRVTAIANAMQRRPVVIVMGVPGSGASLCAHILSALGVDMVGPERGDGAGPWERAELVALHDRILALFNRAHLGPFHDFALPVAWWADPRVAGIKREIVTHLEAGMGAGYFGFKDPRAVRLLPVWQQVANELKLAPRLVLCLRNPAQIAVLSSTREGLDPAVGEYRWFANTVDFFRHANSFDICTVEYESWFEDPPANVTRLKEFLGLDWQQGESDLSLLVSGIVDPAQGEEAGRREPSQPLVRSLYKLARRAGGDGGAREQITNIAFQFVGFQQLQRPFQLAFEEVAKTVAKLPAIERELDALRNAAVERDTLVNTQRAQLNDLAEDREARVAIEAEASGPRATLAEREAAHAELSRKADDLTASLQSAQAEREAQQEALQRAEQAGQQQAASAEAMQGEIAALREALTRAEQAATAAEAAQAELTTLREALGQAEHAVEERAAAAQAAQGEIASLRDTVTRTGQQVQERVAVTEVMQTEIATLRQALARAEHTAQERSAAADAIRGEIAVLREALERTEQEARHRDAAGEAVAAELAVVRRALAEAESATQKRRAAAEMAQAEAAVLREALVRSELLSSDRAMVSAEIQSEVSVLREKVALCERELEERAVAGKALQRELSVLRQTLKQAELEARQSADGTRAMRSEMVRLRDALAERRAQAREQAAAVATFEAEVRSLRGRLLKAEEVAAQRATALAAAPSETEALRDQLAQAEAEAAQRATAAAAIQTEIESLRSRLAQAERCEQELAAATAALQAEIGALQGALEAARQVGKAAIAALQISGEAIPQAGQQLRRWQGVLGRIFGAVQGYRSGQTDLAPQSDRG
jgi:hypothetical protein